MSILSDRDIRKAASIRGQRLLSIKPWDDRCLQPASYDIHLGRGFREIRPGGILDPANPGDYTVQTAFPSSFLLMPGKFVLGTSVEVIQLSSAILGRLDGKSSLGRVGLMVHATAGYLDPGFNGTITLELSNSGPRPLMLRAGTAIGQLSFQLLSSPAERPYGTGGLGSHYQHQRGTTAAKS